ncbi:hypothetical protein H9Q69_011925 [Fusarium xylarioides]|nr:hypothetical protein H9Q70_012038 [Fusarium xylarioides]KAG5789017.1 hypothetical protein H9Q69_011925 [Fusarium xylarioides]KAG5807093.1 hypothetical protein H9Q71_008334 [Fusarium xylarioides]KAG5819778.1 hypothetical protein H9Q74_009272 [Fusarium xylarioides]
MLPVAQATEQIANKISEASDQPACSRPWSPTAIDVALEPDDETHTEPSLYDETPQERDERFRNSRAIGDSQTTSPDSLPATLSYSPELDESQLELSQSDASVSETYAHAYEFDAFSREASEFDVSEFEGSEGEASELDAPEGDAHPADNAPAPYQSPNETEERLNIIRGL